MSASELPTQVRLAVARVEARIGIENAIGVVDAATEKVKVAIRARTSVEYVEDILTRAGVDVGRARRAAPDERGPAPRADDDGEGPPTGTRAVRRVLAEHPERQWSAKAIFEILEERGWLSPSARRPRRGVEAVLLRLYETGEVERVRPGRYVWQGEVEPFE